MKKTRIVGRIIAGVAASAVLLTGALAASPAQAKDTGWGGTTITGKNTTTVDTGWGGV